MEIPKAEHVCQKYCPEKFANLTGDLKTCPFNVNEATFEQKDDTLEITVECSRIDSYLFETIVKRIIHATKDAIKTIKESITQRKIKVNSYDVPLRDDTIKPMYPQMPGTPIYPNVPLTNPVWVGTTSTDNTNTFNSSSITAKLGEIKNEI